MGEVYKALDTRLERTVAIKVLPEHIANREELRGRFEREARAVASLNHPNICTLFCSAPGSLDTSLFRLRRPAESNLAWLEPAICTPVSGPATARCTSR